MKVWNTRIICICWAMNKCVYHATSNETVYQRIHLLGQCHQLPNHQVDHGQETGARVPVLVLWNTFPLEAALWGICAQKNFSNLFIKTWAVYIGSCTSFKTLNTVTYDTILKTDEIQHIKNVWVKKKCSIIKTNPSFAYFLSSSNKNQH